MAAPQFDLFAGAKGFEYARDQNVQDEDNALKSRQNELALGAFERQLKEFEDGAALRKQKRENDLATGQLQGVGLKQQTDYQRSMAAARAALTPEEQADPTVEGGLNKLMRIQAYLAKSGASPETMDAFGKDFSKNKASALRYAQYDPDMLNRILGHGSFGGRYRVNPIAGKDGVYSVSRRVEQAGVDQDGYPLPATYQPVPGSEGNLHTVATSMAAMHSNNGGIDVDAGSNMFDKYQAREFAQRLSIGATERAIQAQQLQDKRYTQTDATANRRIDSGADIAQDKIAARQQQTVLMGHLAERKQLIDKIAKSTAAGDVNATAALQAQLAAVLTKIAEATDQHMQMTPPIEAAPVAPTLAPRVAPLAVPAAVTMSAEAQQRADLLQDQEQDAGDSPDFVNDYKPDAKALDSWDVTPGGAATGRPFNRYKAFGAGAGRGYGY